MEYKRKYRQMDDATKQKISLALKNRTLSSTTKDRIRNSLIAYWRSVPDKPTDEIKQQ